MRALASRDERVGDAACAAAPMSRGMPSARGSTLVPPAGSTPTGQRVAGAVEHLVGRAVAAHRDDGVEAAARPPRRRARSRARAAASRPARRRSAARARCSAVRTVRSCTPEATGLTISRRRGRATAFSVPRSAARASRGTRRHPRRGRCVSTAAACSCASSSITSASGLCSAARSRRFVQPSASVGRAASCAGQLRAPPAAPRRAGSTRCTSPSASASSAPHAAPGRGQLERARIADRARQEPGAAAVGHERDVRERHHQHRVLGQVAEVAGQREREARARRGAVDGRDHGLRHPHERLDDRDVGLADRRRRRRERVLLAQILARAERAPRARQHDAAHGGVGRERAQVARRAPAATRASAR